jgi:hypothetical protein
MALGSMGAVRWVWAMGALAPVPDGLGRCDEWHVDFLNHLIIASLISFRGFVRRS